jgi:hypothetical protein
MRRSVVRRTGVSPLDVDLPFRDPLSPVGGTSLPLLSRGWSLHVAFSPDPRFRAFQVMRRIPSLWTLFAPGEWEQVHRTLLLEEDT